jgi:hypothetical protein
MANEIFTSAVAISIPYYSIHFNIQHVCYFGIDCGGIFFPSCSSL